MIPKGLWIQKAWKASKELNTNCWRKIDEYALEMQNDEELMKISEELKSSQQELRKEMKIDVRKSHPSKNFQKYNF